MDMSSNTDGPEAEERCHAHPDRNAVSDCAVCGRKLCGDCVVLDGGRSYCAVHRPRSGSSVYRNLLERRRLLRMHSPRRWWVTVILAIVGGLAGLHQFYLGRIASGLFRIALLALAVLASGEIEGHFREGQIKHLFIWPALAGGLLEFSVDTFVKNAPARHFYTRFSQTLVNNSPVLALFGVLAMLFLALSKWEYVARFYLVLVMACGGWSGILLVRDFMLLSRNGLTDCRGRLLT